MEIVTLAEAKVLGLSKYFTGKPCSRGHVTERSVSSRYCMECLRENQRQNYKNNPEKARAHRETRTPEYNRAAALKSYYKHLDENRRKARERGRQRYYADPESAINAAKQYRKRNLSKVLIRLRKWQSEKTNNDLNYKIKISLRTRLHHAIKTGAKAGSAVRDLGCSIPEFKSHIEAQFQPGMTWENWGDWHLDHIKPLSSFDLTDRDQFLVACHYTNYQPLWAADNFAKSAKITD